MSSVPRVCSACGAASAWDARFCQQCGRPLDEAPRYYGVLSPGPAFVLGCVLLVAAVVALIAGSVIAAIVLLAFAVIVFVFFYQAARRNPDDQVARSVFSLGDRLRGWVGSRSRRSLRGVVPPAMSFGCAASHVRSAVSASRSCARSVTRSTGRRAAREALLERIREIDRELEKREEARAEALAAARRHVDDERGAARATQRFAVDDTATSERPEEE